MTLSRHGILVALACLPMLLASAGAYADAPGWYAGADLGNSDYSSFDKSLGLFDTNTSADGWSVLGGYQFKDWFGLEFGYLDLGSTSGEAEFGYHVNAKVTGETADAVFSTSTQGFGVFGKVGLIEADAHEHSALPGFSFDKSHGTLSVNAGFGLSYGLENGWMWRLGWTQYMAVGDSSNFSQGNVNFGYLSVLYRF